jgi:cardiolipin synthase
MDRLRGHRVTRRWRYKLAPDPLKRKPKGVLPFWTRARRLFWWWWPWALACLWNLVHDKWGWATGTGLMAFFCYLIAPVETSPQYGLDHEFAIDDDEFLPAMAGATGVPFLPGNALTILNNGDEFYPAMLDAIRGAETSITVEAYIYWAGDIGREFAEALAQGDVRLRVKIL